MLKHMTSVVLASGIMAGCATGAQQQRGQVKLPRGYGQEGVSVPLKAAADMTLVVTSRSPIQLLAAEEVASQEDVVHPRLVAAAPTLLSGGLEVGDGCPERLRLGDTIERGLVQNAGAEALRLTLSNGEVTVRPGEAIYVGDFVAVDRPGEIPGLLATHTIECHCTCQGEHSSGSISLACGAACNADGNQCGMNGNECQWDPDGEGGAPLRTGTTTGCVEVNVPISFPNPGPG